MHVDHFMSMAMKAWVNFLSHFMVMNMYLTLKEDPVEPRRFVEKYYDFIVGKSYPRS